MYGTKDTLSKIFERAIKHNNPKKIYLQMVNLMSFEKFILFIEL